MALPCPGPSQISIADIQTEFGGSNPIAINEYYRNGLYVPSSNTNVPTSGQISFSNFFCAVAEIVVYITTTSTNVNVSTLFGSYWTSNVTKRLIINPGVIVGATNTSNYALTVSSGLIGPLKIDNYGSIQGAGGASNGGTGGNAIFAGSSGVIIDNRGTIYAGGGGGGQGGTGGGGSYTYDCSYVQNLGASNCFSIFTTLDQACALTYSGSYCAGGAGPPGCAAFGWYCTNCARYVSQTCTAYTSGGTGGSGGVGQGYNQSATTGSVGSAGGTNAGTGGTGGTGGSFGSSGSTGGTGSNGNYTNGSAGSSGGLAGYYIVNNGNVTWTNLGTVAGGVG